MDGIVIVNRAGQPVIQSQFTHDALERGITSGLVLVNVQTRLARVVPSDQTIYTLDPEEQGKLGWGPVMTMTGPGQDFSCLVCEKADLVFLAPCSRRANALAILTFLQDFIAILTAYLSPRPCTEAAIRDHFDLVYILLAEMIDQGRIVQTELNALEQVVKRDEFELWANVKSGLEMAGLSTVTSSKNTSSLPWRKPNVRYTNNEIFFDAIEEMDVIMEKNGRILTCDIWLSLTGSCRLSDMPDLLLQIAKSHTGLVMDAQFHPCVRTGRWSKDRLLSFVPPDGNFELLRARLGRPNEWASVKGMLPLEVQPELTVHPRGGSFSVSVKSLLNNGHLEDVVIAFNLGQGVGPCTPTVSPSSSADWNFDSTLGVLLLKIPKLGQDQGSIRMSGTFALQPKSRESPLPTWAVQVDFTIPRYSFVNFKIDSLKIVNESYKPYKGFKQTAQAGRFEIRL